MDPVTVLAACTASYNAIKAGIAAGKEIQHMAGDLASLWDSVAKQAGGVTFDGKPLPADWDGLGADRQACWMAAANAVDDEIERLRHEFRELHKDISMFMDDGPLKQDLLETIADVLGNEK